MPERGDLQAFLKASEGILPDEEREKIAREPIDSENKTDFNELKSGAGEYLQENLRPDQIEGFLDFISQRGEHPPSYLVELGNLLREYGLKEEGKILNEKEKKLVSLCVRYFEEWMYNGGTVNTPDYKKNFPAVDDHEYFATASFLVNQLAKIKERPEHEDVYSFDGRRLTSFFDKVDAFARKYFDGSREFDLDRESAELRNNRVVLNEKIFAMEDELRNLMTEAKQLIQLQVQERMKDFPDANPNVVLGLNSTFVIRRMLESKVNLGQALKIVHRSDTVDAEKFLENSSASEIGKLDLGELGDRYRALESQKRNLEDERGVIDASLQNREVAKVSMRTANTEQLQREVALSKRSLRRRFRERPGQDMYFLKDLIIASEIIRRKGNFYFTDLSLPFGSADRRGPIFNFDQKETKPKSASYKQVHYVKSFLRYAQMTALYLKDRFAGEPKESLK